MCAFNFGAESDDDVMTRGDVVLLLSYASDV